MSIIQNIQKRKNAEVSKEIDSLINKFIDIQGSQLTPINSSSEYGLKDFKENEKILKISDSSQKVVALLIDKKDLPLSKRLCYLSDLNISSNFSYIYNIETNLSNEKDYRFVSISEFEKASQIATVIDQCMNSFENKEEEKLLRDMQTYARICVLESILKDTIKLLDVCDKKKGVYVDTKNANYSLKLLKELQADYNDLPIKKFISKYQQKHTEIATKCVPVALEFLSKQIQTENESTNPFDVQSKKTTKPQEQPVEKEVVVSKSAQIEIEKSEEQPKLAETQSPATKQVEEQPIVKQSTEPKKTEQQTIEQSNEDLAGKYEEIFSKMKSRTEKKETPEQTSQQQKIA